MKWFDRVGLLADTPKIIVPYFAVTVKAARIKTGFARLRPSKNQFFNGTTVLCLSSFGLSGGKELWRNRPFRAIRYAG